MKIKFYILFLLFCLGSSWAYAQGVSQLLAQAATAKTDAEKIPYFLQVARIYKKSQQYELAVDYYFKALTRQAKLNDNKNLATTYEELGLLYQEWQSGDKSVEYFKKANQLYVQSNDLKGQVSTLNNLAWINFQNGNYNEANPYYLKLKDIYEKQNKREALAEILNRLAIASELAGQDPAAITYSLQALEIYQKLGNQDGMSKTLNNLGFLYRKTRDVRKSLQSFNQAVALNLQRLKETKSQDQQAIILNNIGVIYTNTKAYPEALEYYEEALKINEKSGNKARVANSKNHIGANYYLSGNSEKALPVVLEALEDAQAANSKLEQMDSYRILSDIYKSENNIQEYEKYNRLYTDTKNQLNSETNRKAQDVLNRKLMVEQLESKLKISSAEDERQKAELENQKLIADNLLKEKDLARAEAAKAEKERELERARAIQAEKERELARAQAEKAEKEKELEQSRAEKAEQDKALAIANEEKAIALASRAEQEKKLAEAEAKQATQEKKQLEEAQKRRNQFYLFSSILAFVMLIAGFVTISYIRNRQKNKLLRKQKEEIEIQRDNLAELNEEIQQQKEEIESQRDAVALEQEKSDRLLLNILPYAIAQELKETGHATPQSYKMVTVLFTDFRGFTNIAAKMKPEEVIRELDYCFAAFDEIIEKHNMERIKTIGDAYMCAGGIPIANETNWIDAVRAGLEIQHFMEKYKLEKENRNEETWEIRLGIHTGPLVAGVVGRKKFAYDIWGDAVNLASRMESSGEVGKVNISGATYELVKDYFECTYRGKIPAKNKGDVDMYFVTAEKKYVLNGVQEAIKA
jgi:class 3 adenylate cyclase/tetratricopeptide (TPR) repeat protein